MSEDTANVMEFERGTVKALECLVQCCMKHLEEDDNICLVQYPKWIEYESKCIEKKTKCGLKVDGPVWKKCYSDSIKPPDCSGNLYALHTRPCSGSNWNLRYVGKSKTLKKRLLEHLASVHSSTSSQLCKVAHEVSKGGHIGVSFVQVVESERSDEVNLALAGYVEHCIIEKLNGENLWNERKG